MKSHFNYTNRQKIPREQLKFQWVENNGGILAFKSEFDLHLSDAIDPSAEVYVEAHSGPVIMRFNYGTVGSIQPPESLDLVDFPPGLRPIFRVKIVDTGSQRRIIARSDDLTPLSPQDVATGKRSIFPVETLDLGPLVWNIRMEGTKPFLQLNSNIRNPRDISSLAKDPDFVALVYPAAIFRVLNFLLLGSEKESLDDNHEWLSFGSQLAGRSVPDEDNYPDKSVEYEDDVEEWIMDVVKGFSNGLNIIDSYINFKMGSDNPHE